MSRGPARGVGRYSRYESCAGHSTGTPGRGSSPPRCLFPPPNIKTPSQAEKRTRGASVLCVEGRRSGNRGKAGKRLNPNLSLQGHLYSRMKKKANKFTQKYSSMVLLSSSGIPPPSHVGGGRSIKSHHQNNQQVRLP